MCVCGGVGLLCATCMFESHKHCLCSDTALKGGSDGVLLYGPLIYCHIYDGVYIVVSTLKQMSHTEIDDFSYTKILFTQIKKYNCLFRCHILFGP